MIQFFQHWDARTHTEILSNNNTRTITDNNCSEAYVECLGYWTDGHGCEVMIDCWNYPSTCVFLEFQPLTDEEDFEQLTGANIRSLYDGVFSEFEATLNRINFAYNYLIDLNEGSFMSLELEELNVNSNLLSDLNFLRASDFKSRDTLERLYADNNNIAKLTEDLFAMASLNEVFLSGNIIRAVHEDTFSLKNSDLEILDLSSNRIDVLPEGVFKHLPNLKQLNLANNELTSVRYDLLKENYMLTWLSLANNQIAKLPNSFFLGPAMSLNRIYLNGNAMRTLKSIIDDRLINVEIIDLSSNPITVIEPNSIQNYTCQSVIVMTNCPSQCECRYGKAICQCHHSTTKSETAQSCRAARPTDVSLTCNVNNTNAGCQYTEFQNTHFGLSNCVSEIGDTSMRSLTSSGRTRPSTLGGDFLRWINFFESSRFDITEGEYYLVMDNEFESNGTCVVDSENGVDLMCTIPRGTGRDSNLKLYTEYASLGMDLSLLSCDFGYNDPIIKNVTGCPNDRCARAGGDTITLYGANFGYDGAVVFVDGFPCSNVVHIGDNDGRDCTGNILNDDRSCDMMLECITPPMKVLHTFNEHISVVQNKRYHDQAKIPGFNYLPCEKGMCTKITTVSQLATHQPFRYRYASKDCDSSG